MKTAVNFEEKVFADLTLAAEAMGVGWNQLVNDMLKEALRKRAPVEKVEPKPFVQRTYNLGVMSNWSHVKQLLDDEEIERFGGASGR